MWLWLTLRYCRHDRAFNTNVSMDDRWLWLSDSTWRPRHWTRGKIPWVVRSLWSMFKRRKTHRWDTSQLGITAIWLWLRLRSTNFPMDLNFTGKTFQCWCRSCEWHVVFLSNSPVSLSFKQELEENSESKEPWLGTDFWRLVEPVDDAPGLSCCP